VNEPTTGSVHDVISKPLADNELEHTYKVIGFRISLTFALLLP